MMNPKEIRKLLHHTDEQTAKQIAEKYPATDNITKEKMYRQVCERRNAMNQQKESISETYHTPNIKSVPWTRNLGITAACLLIAGGTVGGMWKLTHLETPSETLNSTAENNSNTDSSATVPIESTTFSKTLTTTQTALQTAPVAVTSANTTVTGTNMTTASAITTTKTTPVITTTLPPARKETVIASESQQVKTTSVIAPVVVTQPSATEPVATEPQTTAPPIETTNSTTTTTTALITTRPAYLTAYLEICEEYEKDFNNLSYCLYDVDNDGTPELIIHGFSCWISLYTYADNQVYELMDKWSYGVNNNMGYCLHPEKNSIYYNVGEYAGLICHHVYLTITPEHTLIEENVLTYVNDADTLFKDYPYLKNDDFYNYINGNGYYLNYEKITEEEFNIFYTENYPASYYNTDLDYKLYPEFLASLPE